MRLIDIEPCSSLNDDNRIEELSEFLSAFRRADGQPFAAVHLDIAWWQPSWQERARSVTDSLRGIAEPVGVIYNGNPDDKTDPAWLNSAREHFREYEALAGSPPDQAVLQSWERHPMRVLPETDPTAFTSLIIDYERSHKSFPR